MGNFIFAHERHHAAKLPTWTSDPTRSGRRGIRIHREACGGGGRISHVSHLLACHIICRPHRQHLRRWLLLTLNVAQRCLPCQRKQVCGTMWASIMVNGPDCSRGVEKPATFGSHGIRIGCPKTAKNRVAGGPHGSLRSWEAGHEGRLFRSSGADSHRHEGGHRRQGYFCGGV